MNDTLSNIGTGLWDWLTGPSAAQNSIAQGNMASPQALSAYRGQDLGNLAYAIGRASQQGLGAGTLTGMFGGGMAGAGVQGTQAALKLQQDLAEEKARTEHNQALITAVPANIAYTKANTALAEQQAEQIKMAIANRRWAMDLAQDAIKRGSTVAGSDAYIPAPDDGTYDGKTRTLEGRAYTAVNPINYLGAYSFGAPRIAS